MSDVSFDSGGCWRMGICSHLVWVEDEVGEGVGEGG